MAAKINFREFHKSGGHNADLELSQIPNHYILHIWVDDTRPAPEGYRWIKTVDECISFLKSCYWLSRRRWDITALLDLDHDAGDYASQGGDYIRILDWLEELQADLKSRGKRPPDFRIRIHSMNSVGAQNMRAIIQKNGWTEVR